MEVNTKESLNNLVIQLIENKNINISNKEELFYIIKSKIKDFFLKDGDIPPSFYIKLYNFFYYEKLDIKSDEFFQKNINVLEDYYKQATDEEKYLLNNVLFILQFFEYGNSAVEKYLKRALIFHTYKMLKNQEGKYFLDFFGDKNIKINDRLVLDSLKELINVDKFFSLDKVSQRSIFSNLLSIVWNIPILYSNNIWLDIFDDLVVLLDECIKREMIEEQMYIHFFTYHIYGNNIQTIKEWEVFNKKVEIPASKFYKKFGTTQKLKPCKKEISKGKKKLGFLFDRIVLNSPLMVEYSLFKALLSDEEFNKNYEIYVYSMNYVDKSQDYEDIINSIKALGIKFFSPLSYFVEDGFYYSHLTKALLLREQIINDEIDYLINGFFGYDISNFIFSNRTAPKQIFWSHGNCTSEIENIDMRISHFEQECKNHEWKIFNVPMAEEFLLGSKEDKIRGELLKKSLIEGFGGNTVILGTIGRLVKIESEEYIKTLSEIMKQNPNTIYLACGDGNKEKVEELMRKYEINLQRVVFTGMVNPHIYGWVIDIWLETFPLRQGQSRNEFEAKAGAIVGYKKYYIENAIEDIEKFANELAIKAPLASNLEEYIEITSLLIKYEKYRKQVGKLYLKLREFYTKNSNFLEILDD